MRLYTCSQALMIYTLPVWEAVKLHTHVVPRLREKTIGGEDVAYDRLHPSEQAFWGSVRHCPVQFFA